MKGNYSRALIFVLVLLVAIMAGVIAFAFTSTSPTLENTANSTGLTNKDDATAYLQATERDGIVTIKQNVTAGDQSLYLGRTEVIGDYMYVYGYYYDSSAAPNTSNLTNWKLQTSDLGWGCVAISKTKTTYADPAGAINGHPVTWMTHCYDSCKSLTTAADKQWRLPNVPATAKHTDYIFANCTNLTRAAVTTLHVLDANAFNGCSKLTSVFLGQNVQTVRANAFKGVKSGCLVYCDTTAKPSGFATNWNSGTTTVYYKADILIWAATNNYIPS